MWDPERIIINKVAILLLSATLGVSVITSVSIIDHI